MPGNTVLLSGYACAGDQLARADALMKEVSAPVLSKQNSPQFAEFAKICGTPTTTLHNLVTSSAMPVK